MYVFRCFQKHMVSHLSFSFFPHFSYIISTFGVKRLQNPVLRNISTDYLNQAESRRLRTVNVLITFACDIKMPRTVRMVYL